MIYLRDDFGPLEKASKILNNRIRNFQILPKLEDHPAYKEIKVSYLYWEQFQKRLDDLEEQKKRKEELKKDLEKNRTEVWKNKNWDPTKYGFKDPNSQSGDEKTTTQGK